MTFKKKKVFFFYTSEEKWLNQMAEKGYHLVKYNFLRYHFEEGEPGAYEYRLELLPESPKSESSQEYLDFMEGAGVECVDTFSNWVYFRKKATGEPFEIYTDAASKIKHLNRIILIFGIIAFTNLFIGIVNLINVYTYSWIRFLPYINFAGFLVLFVIILKYAKMKRDIRKNM